MQAALGNERCVAISRSSAWQRDSDQADKRGHGNDHGLLQFLEPSQQRDRDERDQGDDDHRTGNGPGGGGRDAIDEGQHTRQFSLFLKYGAGRM